MVHAIPNTGTADEMEDQTADEAAERLAKLRSRLLTPSQLEKLPPPQSLIDGYLSRATLAALYGRPGTGKSFVALSIALAVVTGDEWFGHHVERGPVLYVAAEGSAGLAQRQRAWREVCDSPDLTGMFWLPMAVSLLDSGWAVALSELVAEIKPALVIIDTLARSMPGGDENSSADMGLAITAADRIRVATDACVLLVHHTPKDGSTLRGHSALEGAVDTALLVEDMGVRRLRLTAVKQKDIATVDPLLLELVIVGDSCVPMLSHEGRGTSEELVESERRVRQAIWDNCGTDGLPANTLLEVSGVPKTSFYRSLKVLHERGIIRNVGSDKRARWTSVDSDAVSESQTVPNSPMALVSSPVPTPPFRGVGHGTDGGGK